MPRVLCMTMLTSFSKLHLKRAIFSPAVALCLSSSAFNDSICMEVVNQVKLSSIAFSFFIKVDKFCPVVKQVHLLTSLETNLFLSASPLFKVKSLEQKLFS